ncbi:MAG TPA: hypothetical protein PKC18_02950 [Lacipirellulaceae bacterium]|nr:hypothetical protein [Lacipirellulaceae bacterium]
MASDIPHQAPPVSTRLRPMIRGLSATLAIVAGGPSLAGCIYYLLNWDKAVADPASVALMVTIASATLVPAYRWITVRAHANSQEILLRGMTRTIRVPTAQVADMVLISGGDVDGGTAFYVLVDRQGEVVARVPSVLEACQNWPGYIAGVRQLIAAHSPSPDSGEPENSRLHSMPWSSSDFRRDTPT